MRVIRNASLFAALALACSSAPPPPAKDVVAARPAGVAPTPAQSPLSPVAAPPDLFVVGRLKNPERSIEQVASWLHLPIPWREALQKELPSLAPKLDTSAALDVTVGMDPDSMGEPEPLFAVSVGLNDVASTVDALRGAGKRVEQQSNGVYFVKLDESLNCVVARSNGKAPGRLVCSEERKALDVLAPYMTRTLPTEELSSEDAYVVFNAEPLRRRFGKQAHMLKVGVPIFLREVSLGNARFDSAMADAAHATVDELILLLDEVDQIKLSAALTETTAEATTQLEIRLKGQNSWSSRTLAEGAQHAALAPDMFWQLPKNVTQATYGSKTLNGERYRPMLEALGELALGAAEHFDAKTKEVEAWIESYKALGNITGPSVYASGPMTTLNNSKAGEPSLPHLVGYHVFGIEGDAGRGAKVVEETVQLWNNPKLRKLAEQKVDKAVQHLPLIRKIGSRGLPAGSTVYEFKLSQKDLEKLGTNDAKTMTQPLVLQLAVVPQGQRTWFVLAAEPKLLQEIVQSVIKADPANTLASREGLQSFRTHPAISGGFATLAEYTRSLDALGDVDPDTKISARDVLLAMPAKGNTPILFRTTASANGPALTITAVVPQAAVQDLTAAIVSMAAQGGAF